jgi:type 1 glutamine amidotransferase
LFTCCGGSSSFTDAGVQCPEFLASGAALEELPRSLILSEETRNMSRDLNRRDLLLAGSTLWLGAGALKRASGATRQSTKKVLFFTKSAGFPHPVVTREGGRLALAERTLTETGKEHGFEVVASKDGRLFEPDKIGEWDAFAFYTTGNLTTPGTDKSPPISADGEKALYDAIRGGKGFISMHSATDTFGHHSPRDKGPDDPFVQMIGGEFVTHGEQQTVTIEVIDPHFPGLEKGFGESGQFTIADEWYSLKNMPQDLHVILVQVTQGMKGGMYHRPNYPMTWARSFGKGRVFYTSMGHREDVWENPKYQGLLIGALSWATGRVNANIEPNIKQVTPHYDQFPA